MLRHFFLISFRIFRKHRSFSFINVFGLALGIACSLLIGLFIHFEYSFDRFHEKADRIYRVYADSEEEGAFFKMLPYISGKLGEEVHAIPEIEACLRTSKYSRGRIHIYNGDKRFTEESILAVDSAFFEVFDFPLLMGYEKEALANPQQIVISEKLAEKCFGEEDPMGKTVTLQAQEATQDYLVAGVMKNLPVNTRFEYDAVVSFQNRPFLDQVPFANDPFSWGNLSYETFMLTREPVADYGDLGEKLTDLISDDQSYYMGIQPLTDIRLALGGIGLRAERNVKTLYTFGLIALIIMLIACINFMNLSTARASTRKLEVGVRKVLGARPGQLFRQFMGEALFNGFLAFVLAFLLADLSLPLFKRIFELELSLSVLLSPLGVLSIATGLLAVSFLAGAYPALVLANQQGDLLRSSRHGSGKSGKFIRKGLVVVQFVASCLLIIGTLVIFRQMDFIQSKDLGFDQEKLVYLPLFGAGDSVNRHVLKTHMLQLPEVRSAVNTSVAWGYGTTINGVGLKGEPEEHEQYVQVIAVEPGYIECLGVQLKAGHGFREDHSTDSKSGFVVNEAFLQIFNLSDPIGTEIQRNNHEGKILGVVKDFHFLSLKNKIEPLLMYVNTSSLQNYVYRYLLLKLEKGDLRQQLDKVESIWTSLYPRRPFTYKLQDEILDGQYREEVRLGHLMGTFSMLAIVIASLGLLGLITFTATQRTKEIGIRKVLGANITDIMMLLTRSYALLLGIAFLIAVPLGAYFMQNWLEGFAYHISLELWIFIAAGLIAALIAALTAGFQSYKAATINPADALRDE